MQTKTLFVCVILLSLWLFWKKKKPIMKNINYRRLGLGKPTIPTLSDITKPKPFQPNPCHYAHFPNHRSTCTESLRKINSCTKRSLGFNACIWWHDWREISPDLWAGGQWALIVALLSGSRGQQACVWRLLTATNYQLDNASWKFRSLNGHSLYVKLLLLLCLGLIWRWFWSISCCFVGYCLFLWVLISWVRFISFNFLCNWYCYFYIVKVLYPRL